MDSYYPAPLNERLMHTVNEALNSKKVTPARTDPKPGPGFGTLGMVPLGMFLMEAMLVRSDIARYLIRSNSSSISSAVVMILAAAE